MYKKIILIVCDSMGIGHAKDAKEYGDESANTLKSIENSGFLKISNLSKLGLGYLDNFKVNYQKDFKEGYCAKLNESSLSKDTLTGHWEMMGLKTTQPLKTFTDTGFPKEFIEKFEKLTGRECIGNIACSGTKILDMYGPEQLKTGKWIVYTSSDSVFQIAANEEIIPLEELYKACKIAREIAMDERFKVGRIIARPYIGNQKGHFIRTSNRHDYALEPFKPTILESLKDSGLDVVAIGKINDIFSGKGITKAIHTESNSDGMNKTIACIKEDYKGLIFTNLVDFDAKYGHRRDIEGYAKAINTFDKELNTLMKTMTDDDLLMITADHGNDPAFKGTDHTREQVPLLIYSKKMKEHEYLGEFDSFSTIGKTIVSNFAIVYNCEGIDLLDKLK